MGSYDGKDSYVVIGKTGKIKKNGSVTINDVKYTLNGSAHKYLIN